MLTYYHTSPVGRLEITSDGAVVLEILFADARHKPGRNRPASEAEMPDAVRQCIRELDEYFAGQRQAFNFPYRLEGTDFQLNVWHELEKIPFGETISYGEQARRVGNKNAARAVGLCNGNNPISIVVPCHRVVGANGSLTGYGGDLWVKEWLLKHEARHSGRSAAEQMSLF